MKIVVTVRKLDNWKEKLIRNIFQSGFFPSKKYTLICGEDFTERKVLVSEVLHKFPSLLREYKLWVA